MPPTIRIDDEVYAWLQQGARPFEDTPNSVLRRLAGIDASDSAMQQRAEPSTRAATTQARTKGRGRSGVTGQQLNEEWGVGARHALYNIAGTWYENLERFPGALFDPHGYVVFATAESFKRSPHLKIGKKTNVAGGISRIPGYVRKT